MYFEECIIYDNIYIGDEIADPCKIIVVGNGGLCKIPHFDLIGGDLHCLISIEEPGFILESELRMAGKYTLTLEERIKLNKILDQKNKIYTNLTNWQAICSDWNNAMPTNTPQIPLDFYMNLKNKPNYAKKNVYFVDNGFYTRIYDDGSFNLRK